MLSDLELMGALHDATSSAEFAKQHLRDVREFKSRNELHRFALASVQNDKGLFLEFGVYKGASINCLAEIKPDVTFYGFDSFHGLPESWTVIAKKGAFGVDGRLPAVWGNVVLVSGFYEHTLEPFLLEHRHEPISFLHVDCDLYSSTKTILTHGADRLLAGSVIVFDEFFNYSGWRDHEYKAFMEFVAQTGRRFQYIGYVRNDRHDLGIVVLTRTSKIRRRSMRITSKGEVTIPIAMREHAGLMPNTELEFDHRKSVRIRPASQARRMSRGEKLVAHMHGRGRWEDDH
jgi:bifunctional DNA-binding transcriptional regulator/antitoxin component of YhaV-PrlF toxin-antitoxin module